MSSQVERPGFCLELGLWLRAESGYGYGELHFCYILRDRVRLWVMLCMGEGEGEGLCCMARDTVRVTFRVGCTGRMGLWLGFVFWFTVRGRVRSKCRVRFD